MSADSTVPPPIPWATAPGGLAPAMLERLGTGAALLDGDGRIEWANAAFGDLHRRQVSVLVGTSVLDLHPSGDNPYDTPGAIALLDDGAATYTFERVTNAGPLRYRLVKLPSGGAGTGDSYLLTVQPMEPSGGPRPGPGPEAMVDGEGNVVAANTAFAELAGAADPSALAGRPVTELFAGAGRARLADALAEARAVGSAAVVEAALSRPDGRPTFLAVVASVAPTGSGWLLACTDITERRRNALLLHEVFDASPLPYGLTDLSGRVTSANPAWRARFGALPDGGRELATLFDSDPGELRSQLAACAAGTQRAFEAHALGASPGGEPTVSRVRAVALHDLSGALERLLVSVEDVTSVALEVEAARHNAQRVRDTLDSLDVAVVVMSNDGAVQEINLGAHRTFGAAASDLVGPGALPPWWQASRTDGSILLPQEHPAQAVLSGGVSSAEATIGLQVGGEPQRWFRTGARTLRRTDEAGGPGDTGPGDNVPGDRAEDSAPGAVLSYVEVTDLELARQSAAASQAAASRAFDALPVACYEADTDLVVVRASALWRDLLDDPAAGSFSAGAPATVLDWVHPGDRRAAAAALRNAAEGRTTERFRHRLALPATIDLADGARASGAALRWVDHTVTGFAANDTGDTGDTGAVPGGGRVRLAGTVVPRPETTGPAADAGHADRLDRLDHLARLARLDRLTEATTELVGEYDVASGAVTYLNPRAAALLGTGQSGLAPLVAPDLYAGSSLARFQAEIWPTLRSASQWSGELEMRRADGTTLCVDQLITAERDASGRIVRLAVAGHDVTDRARREAFLAQAATHDPLTGLANRTLLHERLGESLAEARLHGGLVAVIFLDLDQFKAVNDSYGHEVGDNVLVAIGEAVQRAVRPDDLVARFGGDEFVIICDALAAATDADRVAERAIAAIATTTVATGGARVGVTASAGVAVSSGSDTPDALLRRADQAMYRAKFAAAATARDERPSNGSSK